MFASLFLWLVLGIWLIVGAFAYEAWKRRRQPARHRRWWVSGMCTGAVGYVHTLAYGFALTRPTEVCGQRTFDDDYPLTHVRVDVFPPTSGVLLDGFVGVRPHPPHGRWHMAAVVRGSPPGGRHGQQGDNSQLAHTALGQGGHGPRARGRRHHLGDWNRPAHAPVDRRSRQ
ncbi:hypothetical protein Sgleb_67840 [Streptomyces glebosus]|uniref:Uncharacterized protein n=1 Tax=Streptomyces glebosus TaxID=249580 RepID=A0A640T4V3_9ACTN|nr:hypothetical protein Sgleb_67840 [Streptomyces glebosus]GHG49862.1 hypothetical protein GCM10010513_08170 [Streptomyces glebosus]